MNEYFDFLMFELSDVIGEFQNDSERAHEICIILSACDGTIPETFYRLYTEGLEIDKAIMTNALASFIGMGEIDIECDCGVEDKILCDIGSLKNNPFYEHGKKSVGHSQEWYTTHNRVQELYTEIWS